MTTLKLIRCHRGAAAVSLKSDIGANGQSWRVIARGPLKGCLSRTAGNVRSIYRLGRNYALEFVVTIRISL